MPAPEPRAGMQLLHVNERAALFVARARARAPPQAFAIRLFVIALRSSVAFD